MEVRKQLCPVVPDDLGRSTGAHIDNGRPDTRVGTARAEQPRRDRHKQPPAIIGEQVVDRAGDSRQRRMNRVRRRAPGLTDKHRGKLQDVAAVTRVSMRSSPEKLHRDHAGSHTSPLMRNVGGQAAAGQAKRLNLDATERQDERSAAGRAGQDAALSHRLDDDRKGVTAAEDET
jgi:hypothetical protein